MDASAIMRKFPQTHRCPLYCLESEAKKYLARQVALVRTYFRIRDIDMELSDAELEKAKADHEILATNESICLYSKLSDNWKTVHVIKYK